jgi:hypothetical protein
MNTLTYWEKQPTDNPYLLNGFNGTWAFSDHNLISNELRNFIMESFHPEEKFKRIPLEDINKLMNDVWEGPGSMVKIQKMFEEMKAARFKKVADAAKPVLEPTKTIDDFNEEELTTKVIDSSLNDDD